MPETEIIDKLFLELSQFTKAKTQREIIAEKGVVALSDNEISLVQEALAYRRDTPSVWHWAEIRAFLEKMQTRQLMWEAEK